MRGIQEITDAEAPARPLATWHHLGSRREAGRSSKGTEGGLRPLESGLVQVLEDIEQRVPEEHEIERAATQEEATA